MPRRASESLFEDDGAADDAPRGTDADAPLAERVRPRTLEEFAGQQHFVGEGRVLRRVIEGGGLLPSLILWGPPGTGKTTLARLLAQRSGSRFVPLSAVLSGVKDMREAIAEARERRAPGPTHDPLRRRDPPLQQGPAGRAPARRRGRHRHARSARRRRTLRSRSTAHCSPAAAC